MVPSWVASEILNMLRNFTGHPQWVARRKANDLGTQDTSAKNEKPVQVAKARRVSKVQVGNKVAQVAYLIVLALIVYFLLPVAKIFIHMEVASLVVSMLAAGLLVFVCEKVGSGRQGRESQTK